MGARWWVAVVLVLAVATACGQNAEPDPPRAAASGSPGPVQVPDLTGRTGRDARETLRALGLRPVVHAVRGSGCAPPGVLSQRPRAGRIVGPRTRVVVEVNGSASLGCGIELPPADDALAPFARDLIAMARGGVPPPFTDEVGLYLGNRLIETVAAASLADPRAWRICPPEGAYAAFVCPFSARDHLRGWPGRLTLTAAAAAHSCAHSATAPPGWRALRRVTITPDENLDCTSYWAVELYVDDRGRIASVNLVRSEP